MSRQKNDAQKILDKSIGIRIQNALLRMNYTHDEIANRIGESRVNITRYCNGERQCPSSVLIKIANVCDVSVDYLVGACGTNSKFASWQYVGEYPIIRLDTVWQQYVDDNKCMLIKEKLRCTHCNCVTDHDEHEEFAYCPYCGYSMK